MYRERANAIRSQPRLVGRQLARVRWCAMAGAFLIGTVLLPPSTEPLTLVLNWPGR